MVCELIALTFSSPDPERLAGFWGGLLGQDVAIERGAPSLTALPGVNFSLRFVAGAGGKWGSNQMHPDLKPTSIHEQAAVVDRALELSAQLLDVGQGPDAEHVDVTPSAPSTIDAEAESLLALGATYVDAGCADGIGMADPGGNEFCVVG